MKISPAASLLVRVYALCALGGAFTIAGAFLSMPSEAAVELPVTPGIEAPWAVASSMFLSEPVEPPVSPETGSLAGYTLGAMLDWDPKPISGSQSHRATIADDIARVVLTEPRIWPKEDGHREAIVLARLAWFESRFRDYVDEGRCNEWAAEAYRKTGQLNLRVLPRAAQELMQLGTCDGGIAASLWQIHFPPSGINPKTGSTALAGEFGIDRSMSLGRPGEPEEAQRWHRRNAARAALAMVRRSIQQGAGLRFYVGGDGPERARMAAERLDSALAWSAKHPWHHEP